MRYHDDFQLAFNFSVMLPGLQHIQTMTAAHSVGRNWFHFVCQGHP
jgi:hypothetical protein